ncbi:MAG: hypothetical protein LBU25_09325 [Treponema sp.]|jgi:hypothetical protein|nr:hypothetical protein [Treponema sp.]
MKKMFFRALGMAALLAATAVWASADAQSFTAVTNTAFGMSHVTCVAWGGGKFAAGGSDGKISYSADGVEWTAVGDSKFVAVGGEKIAYSAEGIAWTLVDKSPFYKAECVVYGN